MSSKYAYHVLEFADKQIGNFIDILRYLLNNNLKYRYLI